MKGTVAHEGTHVHDLKALADSYNPMTGKYNASLNLTIFQIEMRGFKVGDKITHEFKSNLEIEDRVRAQYKDLNRHVVPVERTE